MDEVLRTLVASAGTEVAGDLLEDPDEEFSDDLALALGVRDPGKRVEEAVSCLHVDQVDVELVEEGLLNLSTLIGAHETCVNEHAGELVADRLVDERSRHGGVDTAGQRAEDPLVPHLGLDLGDLGLDDRGVGPGRCEAGEFVQERRDEFLSSIGVHDLWMELHAKDASLLVGERRHRSLWGRGQRHRASGTLGDRVSVAHPDRDLVRP